MNRISTTTVLVAALLVSACGSDTDPTYSLDDSSDTLADRSSRSDYLGEEEARDRTFDEDRARDDARADLAAHSYAGIGSPYGCAQDCSGHDAGYRYGSDNDEGEDPGYYGGRSQSFDEGRRAYHEALNERVEQARADFDDGDDEYAQEE